MKTVSTFNHRAFSGIVRQLNNSMFPYEWVFYDSKGREHVDPTTHSSIEEAERWAKDAIDKTIEFFLKEDKMRVTYKVSKGFWNYIIKNHMGLDNSDLHFENIIRNEHPYMLPNGVQVISYDNRSITVNGPDSLGFMHWFTTVNDRLIVIDGVSYWTLDDQDEYWLTIVVKYLTQGLASKTLAKALIAIAQTTETIDAGFTVANCYYMVKSGQICWLNDEHNDERLVELL